MSQAREIGGYRNAEAGGSLIARLVSLTIASIAANTSAEQLFTVVGVLATDLLIGVTPGTVAVAAGEIIVPSRVSAASQIALSTANDTTSAIAAQAALNYNVVIFRR